MCNSSRSFFKTNTVFTGLSAFHVSRTKEIKHRNFKTFSEEIFNQELRKSLANSCAKNHASFVTVFLDIPNKHELLKKKILKIESCFVCNKSPKISSNLQGNLRSSRLIIEKYKIQKLLKKSFSSG